MTVSNLSHVCDVSHSISGKSWIWRGGICEIDPNSNHVDNSLVRQLLLTRGVVETDLADNMSPTIRDFLPDPSIFKDMDVAVERIIRAIKRNEEITVYGDYDVDGATSAALLVNLLQGLKVRAKYYIPDRLLEGYGPTGDALIELGQNGSSLIITVDCGAMAFDALKQAKEHGIDVIVVDHHKCSTELPLATAIINPNRLDEGELPASFGNLAAVGVAFLLAVALIRALRDQNYFEPGNEPNLMALLDLVALGTVADVASLHGLNRAFVKQGLKVMAKRERVGMSALIDASALKRAPQCSDLGFALGPRINAGGRVGESTLGVRLLTTNDPEEAQNIASQLSTLNSERREIEAEVQAAAEEQIKRQSNRALLVLSGQSWHPGVIGIVAGRIKEKTGKPSIVISIDRSKGIGKGSGRSIAGIDIGAAIIQAKENELLLAGGGHPMAAGLTIESQKIDEFSDFLEEKLAGQVAKTKVQQSMKLDLSILPRGLTPELAEILEQAGPFGMGWPAPRVALGPVRIIKADIVGADHVRVIAAGDDGQSIKAIAFRASDTEIGQTLLHRSKNRKFFLAGRVKIDDWGAKPKAELHLEDAAFAD